ncbi:phosphate ABC transporter substrate-binding protein [Mariprofundus erugo]|uniref:Phosphate ABC transporter substrate-binding protein n=1 Tax=Mariprofundus erugo TaxID=2528639 RepID=A0A5R9GNU0_9PROT|nr:phosphate ABC transporter substrate-binding protein [Mariprofundus erugo]TLS66113.1 phosphate ABC transporter substrate-binding protein [Mariprofundus erugo]
MSRLSLFAGTAAFLWASSYAHAGVITSAGSTTVQPAMKACAVAYKKSHADTQVIIAGGGSSKGVKTVGKGKVDIGRASREIKDKELKAFPDMKTFRLGTDGVAIVVNAENPLTSITSAQVEQLYKGEVNNWKAVGGGDGAVSLISLGKVHGTYELFSEHFHLEGNEADGTLTFDKGKAWVAFSQDVALQKVAHDVNAIAFASVGVAAEYVQGGGSVRLLTLDGVEPTEANVASGSYKLSRPLLIMTKGEPTGEVKDFVSYMQGSECQSVVKSLGYVPAR